MRAILAILATVLLTAITQAEEPWEAPLRAMPLPAGLAQIDDTTIAATLTNAFQANGIVKAIILMPMAQEEFFMHRRAKANLPAAPTLLDAVLALRDQTYVKVKFASPFLLLHTDHDLPEVDVEVKDPSIVEELKATRFKPHVAWNDRNWDSVLPTLRDHLPLRIRPIADDRESWHFWRHSLAAWNLDGWEAVQVVALAGRTRVTLKRAAIIRTPIAYYEPDRRHSKARLKPTKVPRESSRSLPGDASEKRR